MQRGFLFIRGSNYSKGQGPLGESIKSDGKNTNITCVCVLHILRVSYVKKTS